MRLKVYCVFGSNGSRKLKSKERNKCVVGIQKYGKLTKAKGRLTLAEEMSIEAATVNH